MTTNTVIKLTRVRVESGVRQRTSAFRQHPREVMAEVLGWLANNSEAPPIADFWSHVLREINRDEKKLRASLQALDHLLFLSLGMRICDKLFVLFVRTLRIRIFLTLKTEKNHCSSQLQNY